MPGPVLKRTNVPKQPMESVTEGGGVADEPFIPVSRTNPYHRDGDIAKDAQATGAHLGAVCDLA